MGHIKFGIRKCDINTGTYPEPEHLKDVIGFVFGRYGSDILLSPVLYTTPVICFFTSLLNMEKVLKHGLGFNKEAGTILGYSPNSSDANSSLVIVADSIRGGKIGSRFVIDRCISYKYKLNKKYAKQE